MNEAMAPPTKRRKLSSSSDNSTVPDVALSRPQPQVVQHARGQPTPEPRRLHHSPTPTEEVVHQEMKRAVVEHLPALGPRQGTGVVSSAAPSPAPSGVQTFTDAFTTLTYTPPILPSLPTLPSVPGATTFSSTVSTRPTQSSSSPSIYSFASNNSSILSSANGTTSTSASSSLTTSAIILIGSNGTTTSKTTLTLTRSSTSTLYLATLDDGDVSTITRSSTAFTTTLDGEVFTIPGYFDSQSRLRTSATTTRSDSDSTAATANADVSAGGGAQTYGTPDNTGSAGPTSTGVDGSNGDDGGNRSSAPPAGTIAGGVVGGAAGLAVIVLIAMLFFRWYRRKSQMGHQALSPGIAGGGEEQSRGGPGMAERAGMVPFAAAVPALFRHHNHATEPAQSEHGFARISGRKLPSQWSEGMTSSAPPTMPLTNTTSAEESERNMSSSSYPRDEDPFGERSPGAASPDSMTGRPLRTSDPVTMSPGPERQPQVHYAAPHNFSRPGQSGMLSTSPPGTATAGELHEPSSSVDPNRGSRFTEDM